MTSSRFLLFPPIPVDDLDWAQLFPWLPLDDAQHATRARFALALCAKQVLQDEAAAQQEQLAASAEEYLTLVEKLYAVCANTTGLQATQPVAVSWRVALFGGNSDVPQGTLQGSSVLVTDSSLLCERVCAGLAVVAAQQRRASVLQQPEHLKRATRVLNWLRTDVLPLHRSCQQRESHVFSPDLLNVLQCAISAQTLVEQARSSMRSGGQPSALLLRAARLFALAAGSVPHVASVRVAKARTQAFAYGVLADDVLRICNDAGVAEALAAISVALLREQDLDPGAFGRKATALAEQNRLVYGSMRVPTRAELCVHPNSTNGIHIEHDAQGRVHLWAP